jgi:uncharacterized protein YnzC (UPF0291/DUF896 family)
MDPIIVSRINELAKKAKSPDGLTEDEIAERAELRRRYCEIIKCDLQNKLDDIRIVDKNGNKEPLKRKTDC